MADNDSLKKAYKDGLRGKAYLGILADDAEMATNRRALEDRARMDEEDRRARVRDEECEQSDASACSDSGDSSRDWERAVDDAELELTETVPATPPAPAPIDEADQFLQSITPGELVPGSDLPVPAFILQPDPWREFYLWYFTRAKESALAGQRPPGSHGNSDPDRTAGWVQKDQISRKAILDGYAFGAREYIKRTGLSKKQLFGALVRANVRISANKHDLHTAAEEFVNGVRYGEAETMPSPGLDQADPQLVGYLYGSAKRLDPSLP